MQAENRLTVSYLQETSRKLIDLIRKKKYASISKLYISLFERESLDNPKKMFLALIGEFHPDRYEFHRKRIFEENGGDHKRFYSVFLDSGKYLAAPVNAATVFIEPEVYDVDLSDVSGEEEFVDEVWAEEDDFSIIGILSSIFLGNSTRGRLEPLDLEQLHEPLILSGQEISDLDGSRFCINLTDLDLSGNSIENIYELQCLDQLESLDLTGNGITDIEPLSKLEKLSELYLDGNGIEDLSPLLALPELKFVSLIGNPVTSMEVINALIERDATVVWF